VDEVSRIEQAQRVLEQIIGTREDGIRYVPLLRRIREELACHSDDASEFELLRRRVREADQRQPSCPAPTAKYGTRDRGPRG
jgi:hypothetical protein